MKVTVIGLGYLGATHAVAMAELGHQVIGIEPDSQKLSSLAAGILPFHEPGLDAALPSAISSGRLSFQSQHNEESASADLHFICVGTPQTKGSDAADTSYVIAAAKELGVKRMDWQVLEWNQLALDFYKKRNAILDSEWVNGRLFF